MSQLACGDPQQQRRQVREHTGGVGSAVRRRSRQRANRVAHSESTIAFLDDLYAQPTGESSFWLSAQNLQIR